MQIDKTVNYNIVIMFMFIMFPLSAAINKASCIKSNYKDIRETLDMEISI